MIPKQVDDLSFGDLSFAPRSVGRQEYTKVQILEGFSLPRGSVHRGTAAPSECTSIQDIIRFCEARDSLPPGLRAFLTPFSPQEYLDMRARLFLMDDGRGGYGLIGQRLISIFSLPGAHYGPHLLQHALTHGAAEAEFLDAHEKLSAFYGQHGFIEISRQSWNQKYAPRQWDYERFGTPDNILVRKSND